MQWQSILAELDLWISAWFGLERWTLGDTSGMHSRLFYLRGKKMIGIVGVDGRIHTVMSYRTVMHEYDGSRLLRRVLVRKSLKKGERLATEAEIQAHRERSRMEMNNSVGLTIIC